MEPLPFYTKAILLPFQRVHLPRAPLQNVGEHPVIVERIGNEIRFGRA